MMVVIIDGEKGPRFEKLTKKSRGKSSFKGIYDKTKFEDEPTTFKKDEDASSEETKEKIKGKIDMIEVDSEGNEYIYEVDETEIESIISRGLSMIKEGSNKGNNNENEADEEKSKEEDEEKGRRLRILGDDTRYEILYATYSPLKQIGLLTFSGGFCSAALIGPRTILTAGHCVHEGDGGDWYGTFRFYPGRTSTYTPGYYGWSRAFTFNGWINDGDYDYDIALIELSSLPNIGWISFGYDSSINDDWYMYSKGYPGDKSYGSMWGTSDSISDANTYTLETDDSDTYDGQSGSAVYSYPSYLTYPRIFAAHSGSGWWFGYYNRHTRITSARFTAFCTWINNPDLC